MLHLCRHRLFRGVHDGKRGAGCGHIHQRIDMLAIEAFVEIVALLRQTALPIG